MSIIMDPKVGGAESSKTGTEQYKQAKDFDSIRKMTM